MLFDLGMARMYTDGEGMVSASGQVVVTAVRRAQFEGSTAAHRRSISRHSGVGERKSGEGFPILFGTS